MTSSETRALKHAALLVLGLGLLRTATESVRSPVTTLGAASADSSGLAVLLDDSRGSRDEDRRRSLPLRGDERIDPNTAGGEDALSPWLQADRADKGNNQEGASN